MTDTKRVFVPAVQLGKTEAMRGFSPIVHIIEPSEKIRRIKSAQLTMARLPVPGCFFVRDGDTFKEVDGGAYKSSRKPVEWIKDV